MGSEKWQPIETAPPKGRFLVWRADRDVREARWMPRSKRWVFPSAQSAFVPTHWMPLPSPPEAPNEQ